MRLFETQTTHRAIVLDLKDVSLVDRDVMGFLAHCEAARVKLENPAPYIRVCIVRSSICTRTRILDRDSPSSGTARAPNGTRSGLT